MSIEEIEARITEIDELLFANKVELDDMERKTLVTEREDLLQYLE